MKCEICGKDVNTIVGFCGINRCLKCDSKRIKDSRNVQEAKPKVVILDDNELSMAKYAEEYPENFEAITDNLKKPSRRKE